jgi:pimeloyl-ACP methyl ester carboxylesterase
MRRTRPASRAATTVVRALAVALPLALVAVACSSDDNPTAGSSDSVAATDTADTADTAGADDGTAPADTVTEDSTGETGETGDTTDATTDDSTSAPVGDDPFEWTDFGPSPGVQTGHLEVPIDYDDPSKGTIDLFMARHLATDPAKRIGTLLVNPGGPGFGGSDYGIYADQVYSEALLTHFDILGWDPRGTGLSEPAIDCIDDYDEYFGPTDITPDTPDERQQIIDLAKDFEEQCATKNAEILQFVGTNSSAADMNAIREALGEETITYFGFSYGSELGATWATLFPDTVRAAVLDGAADPNADFLESGLQQTAGFERTIDTFLAKCSADDACAFNNDGDAEGAFDALMLELDENPVPGEPGRIEVNRGVALSAVAQAMYSESLWPELEQALADAQAGDGAGLLALFDQYFQRRPDGTYDNSLEAFQTISCMDDPARPTVEEDDATAPQYTEVAPRFAPGTTGSYFCTFYPAAENPRVDITGAGAGPILVVGTTGDPATPLESSQNMADALEQGVLLTVTADQHTGYGVNQCSYDVIDGYLVELAVPEVGTVC